MNLRGSGHKIIFVTSRGILGSPLPHLQFEIPTSDVRSLRLILDSVSQIIILHGDTAPKCTLWPISNLPPSNTTQKVTVFFTVTWIYYGVFGTFLNFMLMLRESFWVSDRLMTNIGPIAYSFIWDPHLWLSNLTRGNKSQQPHSRASRCITLI